jgi:hypothetical protein
MYHTVPPSLGVGVLAYTGFDSLPLALAAAALVTAGLLVFRFAHLRRGKGRHVAS